jgi:hypothetical protein
MENIINGILETLPGWAYLIVGVIVSSIYTLTTVVKVSDPVTRIAKTLHSGFVTDARVQEAVRELLDKARVRNSLATWIAAVVAEFLVKAPDFFGLEVSQQRGIIANAFSKLSVKRAKTIVPEMPADVASFGYARKKVVEGILKATDILEAQVKSHGIVP